MWIGLHKEPQGFVWDNGISFDVTKANTGRDYPHLNDAGPVMYHLYGSKFHDCLVDNTGLNNGLVCQGNLDGIDWTVEIN